MFDKSKGMVKGLKRTRDDLMQLAFDYKQLSKVDKMHLSRQLTDTESKLLALLTTIGDMLNEDAAAPALGSIRIVSEHVDKKSWLWGLITKEVVTQTHPPINMSVSDFMKKKDDIW